VARIRTIKPEFFSSLAVARLPITARLTFIGLWTYADDEGRGQDEPRLVKAALWPLDDDRTAAKVDADLTELANAGLIDRYSVNGERYLQIRNFTEHQYIQKRRPSKLPPMPQRRESDAGDVLEQYGSPTVTVSVGKEGKGKERKDTVAGATSSWVADLGNIWKADRGKPPYPRIGKALRDLVQAHGLRQVRAAWVGYLEERRGKSYASPEDFAQNYRVFREKYAQVTNDAGDGGFIPIPDEPEVAA
jgi:hypothetical protein